MRLFFLGVIFSVCLAAQQSRTRVDWSEWEREALLRSMQSYTQVEEQARQRQAARLREQEFLRKVNDFVRIWHRLVNDYNTRGTFNYKEARAVTRAFHALEKSEGWPVH